LLAALTLGLGQAAPAHANIGVSISPTSWNLGSFGANYYVQSASITVTNTGTCYEVIQASGSNSENWTLVSGTPAADQFKLTVYNPTSGWQNLTTTPGTLSSWLLDGASTATYVRFYGPPGVSGSPPAQTILVVFRAAAASGYTYNAAGDFYYRNVGWTSTFPSATWAGQREAMLPPAGAAFITGLVNPPAAWVAVSQTGSGDPGNQIFSTTGWGYYRTTPGNAGSAAGVYCPLCGRELSNYAWTLQSSNGQNSMPEYISASQNSEIIIQARQYSAYVSNGTTISALNSSVSFSLLNPGTYSSKLGLVWSGTYTCTFSVKLCPNDYAFSALGTGCNYHNTPNWSATTANAGIFTTSNMETFVSPSVSVAEIVILN